MKSRCWRWLGAVATLCLAACNSRPGSGPAPAPAAVSVRASPPTTEPRPTAPESDPRSTLRPMETAAVGDAEPRPQPLPTVWPARCPGRAQTAGDDGPTTVVPVEGASGWCIPRSQGVIAAVSSTRLGAVPLVYSDNDALAVLLPPNAALNEQSALTSQERFTLAARARAKTYVTLLSECEWSWVQALGKLRATCSVGQQKLFITGRSPNVTRTQDCDTMPSDSCGDCETTDDCSGWTCGCPQSRCNRLVGQCTACPAERICDDAEFGLTIPPYQVSVALNADDACAAARDVAADSSQFRMLLQFRVDSAWRDVRFRSPTPDEIEGEEYARGQKVLEYDPGYLLGITPLLASLVRCPDAACDPRTAISAAQLFAAASWTTTLSAEDTSADVTCRAGTCTARARAAPATATH